MNANPPQVTFVCVAGRYASDLAAVHRAFVAVAERLGVPA